MMLSHFVLCVLSSANSVSLTEVCIVPEVSACGDKCFVKCASRFETETVWCILIFRGRLVLLCILNIYLTYRDLPSLTLPLACQGGLLSRPWASKDSKWAQLMPARGFASPGGLTGCL